MIKLRRYLAYYKKECIIGPLCKLFEAILELLVPLVMAGIIDNGVRNGDTAYIWRMGGLLVILATVGLCSALVCQYLASKASQGVEQDFAEICFCTSTGYHTQSWTSSALRHL